MLVYLFVFRRVFNWTSEGR